MRDCRYSVILCCKSSVLCSKKIFPQLNGAEKSSCLTFSLPQKALCQQFRKEVHIRNLPSLFKKPKPDKDVVETEQLGLAALFNPEKNAL